MELEWVKTMGNLGAIGILGVFVLRTLPLMVEKFISSEATKLQIAVDEKAKERLEFASRTRDQTEMLADAISKSCQYRGFPRPGN